MTSTPRAVDEALAFMRKQHRNPTQTWKRLCQGLCRSAYGVEGKYTTAYKQWLNTPDDMKHVGGDPKDAPLGSLLCYKGSGPSGHIMMKANPFPNGKPAAWSNDLVRTGMVDKVSVYAPIKQWGHKYLGYIKSVNDHNIVKKI